jgi:hypothetical protein
MASALGFSSQNREGMTASREHLNASLKEHLGDLELAERRRKELGPHRITGAVEADIARSKKDRLWDATSGCTDATLAASREFCKRIDTLRAELALAAEDQVLTSKIEGLKFKVQQLRARGAGRDADPQLGEIARAAGLDILRVRSGMNWLLAIAIEAVSCFGLFAIAWQRPLADAPKRAVQEIVQAEVTPPGGREEPEPASRASGDLPLDVLPQVHDAELAGVARPATGEAEGTRPWRLVSGEEIIPPRRLPAPGNDRTPAGKAKRTRKANGKSRRTPPREPDAGSAEANA